MFEPIPSIEGTCPKPLFVDGESGAGWCIIYQMSDGTLRDGNHVFDTKKEATEIMKLGGEYEGEFAYRMNMILSQVGLGREIIIH